MTLLPVSQHLKPGIVELEEMAIRILYKHVCDMCYDT